MIHVTLVQEVGFYGEEHVWVCETSGLLGVAEDATDEAVHGDELPEDALEHEAVSTLEVVEASDLAVSSFAMATLAKLAYPADPQCVSTLELADHPAADGDPDGQLASCAILQDDTR